MTSCIHGHPDDSPVYCPDCKRIRDAAIKRIDENGGVSPRRLRQRKQREERLARRGSAS